MRPSDLRGTSMEEYRQGRAEGPTRTNEIGSGEERELSHPWAAGARPRTDIADPLSRFPIIELWNSSGCASEVFVPRRRELSLTPGRGRVPDPIQSPPGSGSSWRS